MSQVYWPKAIPKYQILELKCRQVNYKHAQQQIQSRPTKVEQYEGKQSPSELYDVYQM